MFSKAEDLDNLDFQILEHLSLEARITWAQLAKRLNLSAPAIAERVRKLEERGAIRGYHAEIEPKTAGAGLLAFIAVSLSSAEERGTFLNRVASNPAILECHHTAGDDDYLLKVRVADTAALEALLTGDLKHHLPGLRTRTTIALSTLKERVFQVSA